MWNTAPPDINCLTESTDASDQIPGEDENQPTTRARHVPVFTTIPINKTDLNRKRERYHSFHYK